MIKKIVGTSVASSYWICDIQPGGRGHNRYRKKFKTKSLASAFEVRIKNKILDDDDFQIKRKDNRILEDFLKIWFDNFGIHLSSGRDTYDRMLNASLSMGSPVLRFFKPSVFLAYRSKRIESGVLPSTLNRELQTFKTVFNELICSSFYELSNPFVTIKKIRTSQPKTVFLSNEEIKNLFFHLKKADSDAYLISLVCLSTGARWGEAQSLTLSDLTIGMVHFHETKSKKTRSLPIVLTLYHKLHDRLSKGGFSDSYSTFSRRLFDSGIELPKGQRTHVLRHTFASHFIINDGHIKTLQEILGHSSLNMTMRYAHLAPDSMSEILEKNPALTIC